MVGLMRPYALVYFYGRRLRVHGMQELFAGLGVAVAVALVFAVTVAASSLTNSAANVVRAVGGPANLQVHARGPEGFSDHLLSPVEHLAGVRQAAQLLEQTATIIGPSGHRVTVTIAGAGVGLALMDGLAHTLPGGVLSAEGIGLSKASASQLGITELNVRTPPRVTVDLRGRAIPLKVSAVLGREASGALSVAQVAVMPLASLQGLAGLPHRISRILVQSKPGREAAVRSELETLVDGHLTIAAANQEVSLLSQALHPSNQASALFAGLAALLGFLFAFNAILLTAPERRAAIADLRLDGTKRRAIIQMVVFQALCLGVISSLIGLLIGYVLALGVFQTSPGYLAQAFTLGGNTVIGARPIVLSLAGGILATCLASAVPLQDLRRGRRLDAVFAEAGERDQAPRHNTQRRLFIVAASLIVMATALFVFVSSAAIAACVLLALATILAVPLILSAVLRATEMLAMSNDKLTTLPLAIESLRARTLRSLALAATGAVALFGSVALSGAQHDLLRGLHNFANAYATDGQIWVVNPGYIPETTSFLSDGYASRVAHMPEVSSVHVLQSEFMNMTNRRIVIVARPPGTGQEVLRTQILAGDFSTARKRLGEAGWVAVSKQVAEEQHADVGQTLKLPTPTGTASFRIAALTTNFGWPGGAVLMSTTDYSRLWATHLPSALAVDFTPGTDIAQARRAIAASLGANSSLEAITAVTWSERFDTLAGKGLGQLGNISDLLVLAAILAMAAALGSSIWQRRVSLAELLLDGASRRRLRRILLTESLLMLSAGCLAGAIVGVYGQFVIDSYLKHVTGFPVASIATVARPIEMFALVITAVLILVSLPGWRASRVRPALGLSES
jgi:putative ABC transport system permease protein